MSDLTVADPTHPAASQLLYAPLSTANEIVTSAAVSSSGQFLAVGTSGGVLGQYAKPSAVAIAAFHQDHTGNGMKSTELYRVNEVSVLFHLQISEALPPPYVFVTRCLLI